MAEAAIKPKVQTLTVREATAQDLPAVVELDRLTTGMAKPDYWGDLFGRYGAGGRNRFFLVAETDTVIGFIIGEVRAWEFGSPPCGWVFAVAVNPEGRQRGVGEALFEALCQCFRRVGVHKMRTMIARDNTLLMSFFRAQGMMAGPFVELEKELDE